MSYINVAFRVIFFENEVQVIIIIQIFYHSVDEIYVDIPILFHLLCGLAIIRKRLPLKLSTSKVVHSYNLDILSHKKRLCIDVGSGHLIHIILLFDLLIIIIIQKTIIIN